MVGSVTGNDNTVGGGGVYPIADLKNLDGFRAGFDNPIAMADGYGFDGAKAYKDSKLCLMMMSNILHSKYNKLTGIAFSSIYPGCIAESPLFREKRKWFRKYFPVFMKYITGGFVSEQEAGQRLFQVAHDPRCSKSGGKHFHSNHIIQMLHLCFYLVFLNMSFAHTPAVYWSWNGGPRENRGLEALEKGGQISGGGGAGGGWDSIFENDQSAKVNNIELGIDLFRFSTEITGAEWPDVTAIRSPCPTLNVIGAISKAMIEKEELKRMVERPGLTEDGKPIKLTKRKRVKRVAQKVVGGVFSRTVGRVGRFASRRLLGKVPETALEGSYQEEKPEEENKLLNADKNEVPNVSGYVEEEVLPKEVVKEIDEKDKEILQKEISETIFSEYQKESDNSADVVMKSDAQLFNEIMEDKSLINSK